MARKSTPPATVYQIKVTLKGTKPPIWRRIQVPANITLADLHAILQLTMGWYNSHLHQFTIDGEEYGAPDPYSGDLDVVDERRVSLSSVVNREKAKFLYEYDFGDGWDHEVLIEKILPADGAVRYPICLTGRRACPPEDCGGVWGYQNFLEAIGDPAHEEHDELLEWIGGSFDPEAFDVEQTNRALAYAE